MMNWYMAPYYPFWFNWPLPCYWPSDVVDLKMTFYHLLNYTVWVRNICCIWYHFFLITSWVVKPRWWSFCFRNADCTYCSWWATIDLLLLFVGSCLFLFHDLLFHDILVLYCYLDTCSWHIIVLLLRFYRWLACSWFIVV